MIKYYGTMEPNQRYLFLPFLKLNKKTENYKKKNDFYIYTNLYWFIISYHMLMWYNSTTVWLTYNGNVKDKAKMVSFF